MIHARSLIQLAANVLLGITPAERCPVPNCQYRARGPRDYDRHVKACPWARTGGGV